MIDACGADGQRGYARLPLHHPQRIIRIPHRASTIVRDRRIVW